MVDFDSSYRLTYLQTVRLRPRALLTCELILRQAPLPNWTYETMVSRFAQLVRQVVRLVRPTRHLNRGKGASRLESRSELSRRYLGELCELVGDGQISRALAQRVIDDLFEPKLGYNLRQVRLSVWRSYCEDRTNRLGLQKVECQPGVSGDYV